MIWCRVQRVSEIGESSTLEITLCIIGGVGKVSLGGDRPPLGEFDRGKSQNLDPRLNRERRKGKMGLKLGDFSPSTSWLRRL